MWSAVAADRWCRLVDAGHLWVPDQLNNDSERAMLHALRLWEQTCQPVLHVHIDTVSGSHRVWTMAHLLAAHPETRAIVHGEALSAGLLLTVACATAAAVPNAEFLFHGLDRRDCEADDERRAQWFAERTKRPAEFWRQKAWHGEYRFGADEALDIGVIDEVVPAAP